MLDHFEWYVYFLFVFSLIFYLFIYFDVQTKHVYDILEYVDELDKWVMEKWDQSYIKCLYTKWLYMWLIMRTPIVAWLVFLGYSVYVASTYLGHDK